MTSLREASPGRPIDHDALLEAFLRRLEPRLDGAARWPVRRTLPGPTGR